MDAAAVASALSITGLTADLAGTVVIARGALISRGRAKELGNSSMPFLWQAQSGTAPRTLHLLSRAGTPRSGLASSPSASCSNSPAVPGRCSERDGVLRSRAARPPASPRTP
jgi:hypothetical protein